MDRYMVMWIRVDQPAMTQSNRRTLNLLLHKIKSPKQKGFTVNRDKLINIAYQQRVLPIIILHFIKGKCKSQMFQHRL